MGSRTGGSFWGGFLTHDSNPGKLKHWEVFSRWMESHGRHDSGNEDGIGNEEGRRLDPPGVLGV